MHSTFTLKIFPSPLETFCIPFGRDSSISALDSFQLTPAV